MRSALHAELAKIRALPTPRWVAALCLLAVAAATAIGSFTGIGTDNLALDLGAGLTTMVAGVVLGAWVVGLEYGQRTMARSLCADPHRLRLVAAKLAAKLAAATLAAAAGTAAAGTAAVHAVALVVFPSWVEGSPGAAAIAREGAVSVVGSLVAVAAGMAFGLITRSMAGATSAALGLLLVVEAPISAIPHVGDYTFVTGMTKVSDGLLGDVGVGALLTGLLVVAVWLAASLGAGLARFARSDA